VTTRYFINAYNTGGGVYPYDTYSKGAKNFYTLIVDPSTRVELEDGDTVSVYTPDDASYFVDDSGSDIEFTSMVIIDTVGVNSTDKPKIKLKSDGDGFTFSNYANASIVSGLNFHKDDFDGGSQVRFIDTSNILISRCTFTFDTVSNNGIGIFSLDSKFLNINDNDIDVPSDTMGYGILLQNSERSYVQFNTLNLSQGTGNGIDINGLTEGYGNVIVGNTIYNIIADGSFGIFAQGNLNNTLVWNNTINISAFNSAAISMGIDGNYGRTTEIKNNTILLDEDDSGSVGITVPSFGPTDITTYEITNNNIIYNGGDFPTNDGNAMEVAIFNGIVDFNNIVGFSDSSKFFWTGEPGTISANGPNTISVDPVLYYQINPSSFTHSNRNSYFTSSNSQCFGTGENHENIGIEADTTLSSSHFNMVDTVCEKIGAIPVSNTIAPYYNFFSIPFVSTSAEINGIYTKEYGSGDVYGNQFSWETSGISGTNFPFTAENQFYDQDVLYVLANKGALSAFPHIDCPPNPGYNFSAYPCYETGLFGNPRAEYINNCGGTPIEPPPG
jgi:hypothetical protein